MFATLPTMRLLLSNDDGILAPGLAALAEAVADMGDLTIVAPDSPQSAAAHSITLQHPLSVQPVHLPSAAFDAYSVDGRPADCVRLAIKEIMPAPADLVLTGINVGANVGINVFYSGTVAAAAEAVICGVPAVAFSACMTGGEVDFARIAKLSRWVLDQLPLTGAAPELINVNIPALGPGRPLGVRVVHQSTAEIDDVYHPHADDAGRQAYKLADQYSFVAAGDDSDVDALAAGYITVTPLKVDMTHHEKLADLSAIKWAEPPE
ncbi:MAG: 5'/3'-nucleotidase SurE [Phycisphaerae bacterium]|nr:5'/3'-nucleotidase SurE [Phycisphaerae bacterium]